MNIQTSTFTKSLLAAAFIASVSACSPDDGDPMGTGGTTATGGAGTGGTTATGGAGTGGAATGGAGTGTGGYTPVTCDNVPTVTTSYPPTFEWVSKIFEYSQPQCGASDCHAGHKHENGGLRMSDPAQLHHDLTTHISQICGGIPVVTPCEPENSALIKILTDGCEIQGANGPEILRMPAGCVKTAEENSCMPDEYIAIIRQWIEEGASPEL